LLVLGCGPDSFTTGVDDASADDVASGPDAYHADEVMPGGDAEPGVVDGGVDAAPVGVCDLVAPSAYAYLNLYCVPKSLPACGTSSCFGDAGAMSYGVECSGSDKPAPKMIAHCLEVPDASGGLNLNRDFCCDTDYCMPRGATSVCATDSVHPYEWVCPTKGSPLLASGCKVGSTCNCGPVASNGATCCAEPPP